MAIKFLVTGATGFIGNHLINKLLNSGYEVVATSSSVNTASNKDWFNKVIYKELDLNNFDHRKNLYDYFDRPDILIHLAWHGLPQYNDDVHLKINLPQQKHFIENILRFGLKKLIVTGTCFEYGMKEGALFEEYECNPVNNYAIAKHELYNYINLLIKENQTVTFTWARLFYMYGEGQFKTSLYQQLLHAIEQKQSTFKMSKGDQTRDFLPIEKVVLYLIQIALYTTSTDVLNVCSGAPQTVLQFVQSILNKHQYHLRLETGFYPYSTFEPMHFWGNNFKLLKLLEHA